MDEHIKQFLAKIMGVFGDWDDIVETAEVLEKTLNDTLKHLDGSLPNANFPGMDTIKDNILTAFTALRDQFDVGDLVTTLEEGIGGAINNIKETLNIDDLTLKLDMAQLKEEIGKFIPKDLPGINFPDMTDGIKALLELIDIDDVSAEMKENPKTAGGIRNDFPNIPTNLYPDNTGYQTSSSTTADTTVTSLWDSFIDNALLEIEAEYSDRIEGDKSAFECIEEHFIDTFQVIIEDSGIELLMDNKLQEIGELMHSNSNESLLLETLIKDKALPIIKDIAQCVMGIFERLVNFIFDEIRTFIGIVVKLIEKGLPGEVTTFLSEMMPEKQLPFSILTVPCIVMAAPMTMIHKIVTNGEKPSFASILQEQKKDGWKIAEGVGHVLGGFAGLMESVYNIAQLRESNKGIINRWENRFNAGFLLFALLLNLTGQIVDTPGDPITENPELKYKDSDSVADRYEKEVWHCQWVSLVIPLINIGLEFVKNCIDTKYKKSPGVRRRFGIILDLMPPFFDIIYEVVHLILYINRFNLEKKPSEKTDERLRINYVLDPLTGLVPGLLDLIAVVLNFFVGRADLRAVDLLKRKLNVDCNIIGSIGHFFAKFDVNPLTPQVFENLVDIARQTDDDNSAEITEPGWYKEDTEIESSIADVNDSFIEFQLSLASYRTQIRDTMSSNAAKLEKIDNPDKLNNVIDIIRAAFRIYPQNFSDDLDALTTEIVDGVIEIISRINAINKSHEVENFPPYRVFTEKITKALNEKKDEVIKNINDLIDAIKVDITGSFVNNALEAFRKSVGIHHDQGNRPSTVVAEVLLLISGSIIFLMKTVMGARVLDYGLKPAPEAEVTGDRGLGKPLTAEVDPPKTNYQYQWWRGPKDHWQAIANATAAQYTQTAEDKEKELRVTVKYDHGIAVGDDEWTFIKDNEVGVPVDNAYSTENGDSNFVYDIEPQVDRENKDEGCFYTITKGNEDGIFTIDQNTGKIYLSKSLADYPDKKTHELSIEVTHYVPKFEPVIHKATITINVTDTSP